MDIDNNPPYATKEIDHCIRILTHMVNNGEDFVALPREKQIELITIAGQLSRPDCHKLKQRNKAVRKIKKERMVSAERKARAATGIRRARQEAVFSAPLQLSDHIESTKVKLVLQSPRNCYVCKAAFTRLHFFYDTMCPGCAELNYHRRFQTADLRGEVPLDNRIKVENRLSGNIDDAKGRCHGYCNHPLSCRRGVTVFQKKKIITNGGTDYTFMICILRHTPSVELFCSHIERSYDRLDILVNNAAQTVRRPPGFYAHLMHNETKALHELPENAQRLMMNYQTCTEQLTALAIPNLESGPALPVSWHGNLPGIGLRESAQLSQIPYAYDHTLPTDTAFPRGELDVDLQQVDLRTTNSWRLKLGEIQTAEMLEIQLINAVAPFVLCNKLAPLMKKDNTGQKHIVNVSAMEGKFMRFKRGSVTPIPTWPKRRSIC